jgi:Holliday junction DNA helicase RuvA
MLEYITGKISEKRPTYVVIDTGGIGYRINIPLSTYNAVGNIGDPVKLFTVLHLRFRQDTLGIYGFSTEEERTLFNLLLTVTRVGPKNALAALSTISTSQLRSAIASGDIDKLCIIPGISKTIAQRLVVELKEKVKALAGEGGELIALGTEAEEAVLALEALGFAHPQAVKAVETARKTIDIADTGLILRKALSLLTQPL